MEEEKIKEMINLDNLPEHVAIIMDGNRRWAKQHNLPVPAGHKQGAETLKKIAKFANKIGIKYMTVYAFSTENWKRSEEEVGAIMKLLKFYILDFFKSDDSNIKVRVIGKIEKLPKELYGEIKKVEEKTKNNTGLVLNIAFNYGGRDEIVRAVKKIAEDIKENKINIEDIDELYHCIFSWRSNLCTGTDLNGKNKDASGTDHGITGLSGGIFQFYRVI